MTMVDDRTVILQLDEPAEPEAPRFFDCLELVALSTAVSCACTFMAYTMRSWKAGFIERQAVTLTRELTIHAVAATGYTKPDWYQERLSFITVRVFGFKEGPTSRHPITFDGRSTRASSRSCSSAKTAR